MHAIARLVPRHYSILELALLGYGPKEIALSFDPPMTPQGVGQIMAAPIFQNELSRRRASQEKNSDEAHAVGVGEAKSRLAELALAAVNVHGELMEGPNEASVRQRSADSILNKVFPRGTADISDSNPLSGLTVITIENFTLLREALKESNIEPQGVLVEEAPQAPSPLGEAPPSPEPSVAASAA